MGLGNFLSDLGEDIYHGTGEIVDTLSGHNAAQASREAGRAGAAAYDKATGIAKDTLDQQLALNKPWQEAGVSALSDLQGGIRSGAFNMDPQPYGQGYVNSEAQPGQYQDPGFRFEADPGYKFRQEETLKGMERSAAAGGGLFSGSTLSSLAGKAGQMASEEYGNAYGRYSNDRNFGANQATERLGQFNTNRNFGLNNFQGNRNQFNIEQQQKQGLLNDRFNRLSTLAGFGSQGNANAFNALGNYGNQASSNLIGGQNSINAGQVGAANAVQQGAGNILGAVGSTLGAASAFIPNPNSVAKVAKVAGAV